MVWESDGKLMKTPSTYSLQVEDLDADSYTSIVTGELIDTVIVTGMVRAELGFDCQTEAEAQELMTETWKNPMNLTIKSGILQTGILSAPFRCARRRLEMLKTDASRDTSETLWRVSFSIMQKQRVSGQ